MTLGSARWVAASIGLMALVGGVCGAFHPVHLAIAGVVIGLFGPAAILCEWLEVRLGRRGPAGAVAGMLVGMIVRGAAALGGGCLVFFGVGLFRERPLTFWLWVCGGYVVVLVAGVASQIDAARRPGG